MTGGTATSTLSSTNAPKRFIGKLQASYSRAPEKPAVNFAKGGSDFRCPNDTSGIGRQVLSYKASTPSMRFFEGNRFGKASTVGPGPAALGQTSSLKNQTVSTKKSAGCVTFGTSTRDGALKMYSLYTSAKR